jgi:tRNA-specific 2-thiouridylase
VAPGQTAVLYAGTRVLGQCTIDRTVSAVPVTSLDDVAGPVSADSASINA